MRCSGLTEEMYVSAKASAHLVWMCTACKNLISKARFANALVSVSKASETVIESIKTEIRESVLEEIKNEIKSNFKTLINSVPRTPQSFYRTPLSQPTRSKRLRENDGDDDVESRPPAKAMCGVGTCEVATNLVVPETTDQDSAKFWLYLSGILPEVPEAKVVELAESQLKTSNLRVVKLVARGRDPKSLSFVSYKIGMPLELKSIALAAETWPRGIRFREFENLGSKRQFFWRPTLMTPTPSVFAETPTAPSIQQR